MTRWRSAAAIAAVLAAGAGRGVASSTTALAANPTAPFTQCPKVGVDTSCKILIVIQPDGSLTILSDPTQRPFDGGDDTLVGVVNNSAITVPSIAIGSTTQPVFGFEGDGLCFFVFVGNGYCSALPKPPTGYEGPDTRFSNISGNKRDGTVNFTDPGGGLMAGGTTFFSLELAVDPTRLGTGAVTSLLFNPTSASTSDNADTVTVAATLKAGAAPIANAPVTFTLAPGPSSVSCAATTDALGVASCALTPMETAGAYQVTASYSGSSVPFLAPVNANAPFTVTLEQDGITYTGPSFGVVGQPLVLAGTMTTDDPAAGAPLAGRTVRLTLGSGATALSCNGLTNVAGVATCIVIVPATQAPGNAPVSATYVNDGFYLPAMAVGTVSFATPIPTPQVGAGGALLVPAGIVLTIGGFIVAASGRRRRSG